MDRGQTAGADQALDREALLQRDGVFLGLFLVSGVLSLVSIMESLLGVQHDITLGLAGLSTLAYCLAIVLGWFRVRRTSKRSTLARTEIVRDLPGHSQAQNDRTPTTLAEEIAAQEEYANEQLVESLYQSGFLLWQNQWVQRGTGEPMSQETYEQMCQTLPQLREQLRRDYWISPEPHHPRRGHRE